MKSISIFISSIISSLLLLIFEYYSFSSISERERYYEYYEPFSSFLLYTAFQIPIYIILGIPVSYLFDFIWRKSGLTRDVVYYIIGLIFYTFIAILLPTILTREFHKDSVIFLGIIPVLTYFHVLFFMKIRLKTKDKTYG
jgi:hypothetical protein